MKLVWMGLAACAVIVLMQPAAQASAQDAKHVQVRALAATCANCHGSDGRPPQGSALPPLAGMPRALFLEKMRTFKGGGAGVTVMHEIAKGFNEAQIEQMASYFATQK
jgi:cytochrome subunit of sulfide dehydrogenase